MCSQKKSRQDKRMNTWMTSLEVARIFNVHPATIRRWSDRGIIRAERTGTRGHRRFSRENVTFAYLQKAINDLLKVCKHLR
jgi:excisionase family DNA binding protein